MVLSNESVMAALKPVIDPEIGMSIVDLGMVKDVKVAGDDVYVKIALTVSGCPLVGQIREDVKTVLKDASAVNVEFITMTDSERETVRERIRERMESERQAQPQGAESAGQAAEGEEAEEGQRPITYSNKQPVTGITQLVKPGIRSVIAIASGKGGVGKSFVTGMLASELARQGYLVGVLDADITGPSMAKIFGLSGRLKGGPEGVIPAVTKLGIKVMSMNLVLEKPEDALVWRGPILNSVIRQMYTDVDWGDLHFLLIDLPPGTSDAPLTVYQSMPVNGVVIVSTPQDLASMIVKKAIKMAKTMKIPVLGLTENMSYLKCPACGEQLQIFGPSRGEAHAKETDIPYLGAIPLDPKIPELSDKGQLEDYESPEVKQVAKNILQNLESLPAESTAQPAAGSESNPQS
ncbi:MAG: Mrp/NBP35 family ATP-binding protein [Thaumarchaeota archaeon]|nr:Mrp/NBP35 family ATP-binding protein [Nitrososphaerota archaeon]MCL5318671.1 Mrp/NBP35 family ATP-binding protein [Nitrososphaerota archaeon]